MPKFIIDKNLPYHFCLWHNADFVHVFDLEELKTDLQIWNYAKSKNLTIITKDADFSNRIMFSQPPPKVIHLKVGNLKIADLHDFIEKCWPTIINELEEHKLVNVYLDRIESFE